MKKSDRSKNSVGQSHTMANAYSDSDLTGVNIILEQGVPVISGRQDYSSLPSAAYYHVKTGALALSVLPWPIPATSGLEGEREVQESMEDKFTRLADAWEDETKLLSSMNKIVTNNTHLQIVAMGPDVVPLILKRMRYKPGWWFEALRFLTGQDPVADDARGKLDAMTKAWLEWGEENGRC